MSRPAGFTHSAETRAKMSAALKGRVKSPEERAKISAANRRRTLSPEWRAKIAAAGIGRVHSPETRAKIGAANRGNRYVRDAPVKGECAYCFGPATAHDHVIPRGRPGWDDPDNVVVCCMSCNSLKHNRTPEEWFAAEGL